MKEGVCDAFIAARRTIRSKCPAEEVFRQHLVRMGKCSRALTCWVPNTKNATKGTAKMARVSCGLPEDGAVRRTQRNDDVPGKVRHAREEDHRRADADDAHEAEDRDTDDERERDRPRTV